MIFPIIALKPCLRVKLRIMKITLERFLFCGLHVVPGSVFLVANGSCWASHRSRLLSLFKKVLPSPFVSSYQGSTQVLLYHYICSNDFLLVSKEKVKLEPSLRKMENHRY